MKGISAGEAEQLEAHDLKAAEFSLRRCREQNLRVLALTDPAYPERLHHTATPPAALFVQGTLPDLENAPVLAVIGTRNASPYGLKMSRDLAQQISLGGATVLSLLTPGADEAAAKGALKSGKPCIAVLGMPHEACRWSLMREVAKNGAVISEYPPGKEQFRHFFRERNRVAAGLCDGVVVTEAPEKSGTRLFVAEAAEQGKDVFAVPGNADAENSAGTLALLKEGAKLVTDAMDVLEEYLLRFPHLSAFQEETASSGSVIGDKVQKDRTAEASSSRKNTENWTAVPPERVSLSEPEQGAVRTNSARNDRKDDLRQQLQNLSEDQLSLLTAISPPASHVDEIAERSSLPVSRVLAQLTVLEIKGYVNRLPGRYFSLRIR